MSPKRCVLYSIFFLIFLFFSTLKAFSQEVVVLKVILNTEDMGNFFVILAPEGDVWIKRDDLEKTRLKEGLGRDVIFSGETHVSLSSIPELDFFINEKDVSLELWAAPHLFKKQSIDIFYKKPYDVVYTEDNSAFLNYGLLYNFENSSLNLSTELGVRLGDYLGISTFNYQKTEDEDKTVRLLTSVRTDDRKAMRTMIFGDLLASSGVLGSGAVLGGISLSRNFSTDPYFLRFPSLSLSGTLETPSDVEVYINGRVLRERLFPGEFLLKNIPPQVGLGTADIVITDIYGRKSVISKPVFSSNRLLKKGLHEYSYSIGFMREDFGEKNFSYGDPAFFSFHNYGFSERLKGGYAFEAHKDLINIGPTASVLISKAGVLDAALSLSGSEGKKGIGGFLGYSFRSKYINAGLSIRSLSRDFGTLALRPSDDKPSFELTSVIGLSRKRIGSISAGYSTSRMHTGADASQYGLSYNRVITSGTTFFMTGRRTEAENRETEDEVFFGLHISFGKDFSGILNYSGREGEGVMKAGFRKSLPTGRGFGFRAEVEKQESRTDTAGAIQYQNNYGIYNLEYRKTGGKDSYTLSASGGIGYIGRSAFFSRPISDSFGKVKVGRLEGVRVYYFGNEVGRTNRKGEFIVPGLRSYHNNRIDIESQDIPIDYSIPALTRYISPPFRGGSFVRFDVVKIQGLTGSIYIVIDGEKVPVEYSVLYVMLKDKTIEGLVGRGGEFYIENVPPGRHPAKIIYKEKECVFDIITPESEDIWVDMGKILCDMEK